MIRLTERKNHEGAGANKVLHFLNHRWLDIESFGSRHWLENKENYLTSLLVGQYIPKTCTIVYCDLGSVGQ